jgi:WD40 repeat protein
MLEIDNELQIHDLILLHNGKLITLNSQNTSILKIYNENNYQLEHTVLIENKINFISEINNKIYCCLDINRENICILSTDTNYEILGYLNEHYYPVTAIIQTFKGYLVSCDKSGEILVWNENEKLKKRFNLFNANISNIYEINQKEQQLAVFSYDKKVVKFIDLRYEDIFLLETIENIYASGIKNNMAKLNEFTLAMVGTYIYIINLPTFTLTNIIYTFYSNFTIVEHKLKKHRDNIYFVISQSLANNIEEDEDKGTLGLYKYIINDELLSEQNELIKLANQENCHKQFIISIIQIDEKCIATGCSDGTFKIWKINL